MFAASTLIPNQHCIATFAGAAVVVLQLGAAITPAHSAGGEAVKISNAWVAAEQVGGNVALSMTIKNEADVADALLRVRCPVANFSEKHTVDRGEGSPAMRDRYRSQRAAQPSSNLTLITSCCCRHGRRSP